MIQEWTKKVKAKNEKEPSDSKYVWRGRGSPSKGLYMKRIEKRWPLSTNEPQAIRVGLPLDRHNFMSVNSLLTLLLLTIVKPYLSTSKQLHYVTL